MTRRALTTCGLTLAAFAAITACGLETIGEPITYPAQIRATTSTGKGTSSFENSKGWTIQLDTALTTIGPIYFYQGIPMAQRWLRDTLGPRSAYACPAHAQFDKGTVLGAVKQQWVLPLLSADPLPLPTITGLAGKVQSFEVHFHPPGDNQLQPGSPASEFDKLGGKTLLIEGTAQKGAEVVSFHVAMDIPNDALMRIVQSIPAQVPLTSTMKGTLEVEILVDRWFTNVDFSSLSKEEAGKKVFTADTQAWVALMQGVRARESYRLQWVTP